MTDKLQIYKKLIDTIPGLELKGAGMPYTAVNGNMFSFMSKDENLSLRLPADTRERIIKKYEAALSVQHGVIMKEYILVPDVLLKDIKSLVNIFRMSYEYALILKPKSSVKKK